MRPHTLSTSLVLLIILMAITVAASYTIVSSQSSQGKYDTNNDKIIEISTLEQLDAVRYDLDGNGAPDDSDNAEAYGQAFPTNDGEQVCSGRCVGYELKRSLDFKNTQSYASGKINTDWTSGNG